MQGTASATLETGLSGTDLSTSEHGAQGCGAASLVLMVRVGRVLQDMAAVRALTDAEVLQHAVDCSTLMEQAYQRFEETGNPADREEACLWMDRAAEARRVLSPAWKAAREAEIQQAIGDGCFFVEQGEAARARIGGRR